MKKRVHIFVSGLVQGVFYRAETRSRARALGITGWVRNLPDGRVEIMAEGGEEGLRGLVRWCRRGPPGARVSGVETEWLEDEGEGFGDFSIRYF